MIDPVLAKYSEQFIDEATGDPVAEEATTSLRAVFYMGARPDQEKTKKTGRPVFVEEPFIKMMSREDPWNVIDRPANEMDKRRFPQEWARYENERVVPVTGTPLNIVPWMTPGPMATLAAMKIKTVEALADEEEARLGPDLAPFRQQARDFIAAASGLAPVAALRAEVEALRAQLAVKEQAKPKKRPRARKATH
jgi:hypothetical protein